MTKIIRIQSTTGTVTTTVPAGQSVTVEHVNDAPIGLPTISGTPTAGQSLVTMVQDVDDPNGLGAFGYQWLREGVALAGETSVGYQLTAGDVGATLSVAVSYTDGGGTVETLHAAAVGPVAAHVPPPPPPPPPAGNTWALTAWGGSGNGGIGLGALPRHAFQGGTALAPFTRVRAVVGNLCAAPMTITDLRIKSSPAIGSANMADALPLTFGGVDSVTLPPALAGAPQYVQALDVSDIIELQSVAPSAGLPVFHLSGSLLPQNAAVTGLPGRTAAQVAGFRDYSGNPKKHQQAGQVTQAPGSAASVTLSSLGVQIAPAVAVDYGVPCVSMALLGESLHAAGYENQNAGIGMGQVATLQALEQGRIVGVVNTAQNGKRHDQMLQIGREWLRIKRDKSLPLTHMAYPAFSVNSGGTQAILDQTWDASVAFAAELLAEGVTPVIMTSPYPGTDATGRARIDAHNARVRSNAFQHGYVVADVAAGWDEATMTHTDNQHWTQSGQWHAAAAVLAVV